MERWIGVVVKRELPLQLEGNVVVLGILNGSKELCQRFHFGFSVIQQPMVENAQIPHRSLFSIGKQNKAKEFETEDNRRTATKSQRKKVKVLNPALNPRSPFPFSFFLVWDFPIFFTKTITLFFLNKSYTLLYLFLYIILKKKYFSSLLSIIFISYIAPL